MNEENEKKVLLSLRNVTVKFNVRGRILTAIRNEFPGHTFRLITADGVETELDSILTLISLALTKGSTVLLQAEGVDEDKAIKRIGDLFEFEFDFPPRR